jgi:hypothetical protein
VALWKRDERDSRDKRRVANKSPKVQLALTAEMESMARPLESLAA